MLDLIETPADTFDLKVFNSDSEYREKFAEMFYEKTGIQLKERRFWEYYNNSVIDGENKKKHITRISNYRHAVELCAV